MTERELRALLVNSEFSTLICDFKREKNLTWEQVYSIYTLYIETVQFFAMDESDRKLS